jgi:hypothetical protein
MQQKLNIARCLIMPAVARLDKGEYVEEAHG